MNITVFANGNPRNPQTWSNVPYYAIKSLEKKGHVINCVNLDVGLEGLIKGFNFLSRKFLGKDTMFLFNLLPISNFLYNQRIRKALKMYPDTELMLFFTYNVSGNEVSKIPSVLFCDFTVEYNIHYIQKRDIRWYERGIIENQDLIMKRADRIVSLFPQAADHYKKYYKRDDIRKIDGHIINCDWAISDYDNVIKNKYYNNEIVFIGRKAYRNGAKCLINVVKEYNRCNGNSVHLSVIGMTAKDLQYNCEDNDQIEFFGVLDKSNSRQYNEFYHSIENAKLIVNTTKNWGGISSVVEAMYLYTPVITTQYSEFLEIFGDTIDFGMYCKAEDEHELLSKLTRFLLLPEEVFRKYAINAHNQVERFTWDKNVEIII